MPTRHLPILHQARHLLSLPRRRVLPHFRPDRRHLLLPHLPVLRLPHRLHIPETVRLRHLRKNACRRMRILHRGQLLLAGWGGAWHVCGNFGALQLFGRIFVQRGVLVTDAFEVGFGVCVA